MLEKIKTVIAEKTHDILTNILTSIPDVKFIPSNVPVNAAKSSDTAIFCGVTGNKSIIVFINQIKKY